MNVVRTVIRRLGVALALPFILVALVAILLAEWLDGAVARQQARHRRRAATEPWR